MHQFKHKQYFTVVGNPLQVNLLIFLYFIDLMRTIKQNEGCLSVVLWI